LKKQKEKKKKMAATKMHKLHYFGVRSRAESLRMLLKYTGQNYEDKIITVDQWMNDVDGVRTTRFPPGPGSSKASLPVLEIAPEGTMLPDSLDIALWIAKTGAENFDESDPRHHLLGEDSARSKMLFRLQDTKETPFGSGPDLFGCIDPILSFFPAEKSESELVAPFLSGATNVLRWFATELKGGDYFGGKHPSYADFQLFYLFANINLLDGGVTLGERIGHATPAAGGDANDPAPSADEIKALRLWYSKMESIPEISEYLKERPKPGSGPGKEDGTGIGNPGSIIATTEKPSQLKSVKDALAA
jgi:glutathione S-transferase